VSQNPRRAFDVRTDVNSGSVLLIRGTDAFELDDVGAHIWSLCDGSRATEDVIEEIVGAFEVDQQVASDDVQDFLKQLTRARLLEE
jgi:hypothetical protein